MNNAIYDKIDWPQFFHTTFFTYIKMSKNSSVKYDQNNKKERLQKKSSGKISKVFIKKERKKSDNMVVNDTKIYQKMRIKSLLSIEKNIMK